jgi:hypothetical protein
VDRIIRQEAISAERTSGSKISAFARAGGWLAVLAIIILSTVPGYLRPHVLANGRYEHFSAYFIAGALFGIGYSLPKHRLTAALMLALCSGILEIVQLWIPDRTANVSDSVASTFGAWTALILVSMPRLLRPLRG